MSAEPKYPKWLVRSNAVHQATVAAIREQYADDPAEMEKELVRARRCERERTIARGLARGAREASRASVPLTFIGMPDYKKIIGDALERSRPQYNWFQRLPSRWRVRVWREREAE